MPFVLHEDFCGGDIQAGSRSLGSPGGGQNEDPLRDDLLCPCRASPRTVSAGSSSRGLTAVLGATDTSQRNRAPSLLRRHIHF